MKRSILCVLVFGLCLVSIGRAQTVTGSGTIGTLPIFTGSSTIGNSAIIQFSGKIGIGTASPRSQFDVFGGTGIPSVRSGMLVSSELRDTTDGSIAIEGLASGNTGQVFGVNGVTFSDEGIGVLGNRANSTASGFGGGGVRGQTAAANFVFTYGTAGVATASTGSAVGILGQAFSPNGTAGLFANVAGGNIIIGGVGQPEITVFRVDGHGTIFADGGFRPFGADFAESLAVKGGRDHYAPGDLLVIDASGERRLSLAETPYSTLVAGIYSTKPGVVASQHRADDPALGKEVPLAVVGVVPCKVTAENGAIAVGDLLVASSTPGHAMKGTDRAKMLGAIVGKALEPLGEGKGVIQVLVTLQ